MRFFVAGKDRREVYLKHLLEEKGFHVSAAGPWDAVVLPLPRFQTDEKLLSQFQDGQIIVCGKTDPVFDQRAFQRAFRVYRVLEDPEYAEKNAYLTAEGAAFYAAYQLDSALCRCRCLVIGYGRIGKALTKILRGIGAEVCAAARREESRREAGKGSLPIERIDEAISRFDAVFNTVPSRIVGRDTLTHVKKSALLMDLASVPYGIDLEAAKNLGINAVLESGVPGRYCPRSAAALLMEYMEREGILYA